MKIKGIIVTQSTGRKKFVDNQGEWAEDLINKWGCEKYFESILCHVENVPTLEPNTMYIFCQTPVYALNFEEFITVNLDKELKHIKNLEMDGSLDIYPLLLKEISPTGFGKLYNFVINHEQLGLMTIAQYMPETNVLWTCDMSHNNRFNDSFKALWDILVAGYLKEFKPIEKPPNVEIMLGADPEFEVLNDGCIIMCPTTVVKGSFDNTRLVEAVGTDGARTQIELRPKPAKTPEQLVENIKILFENINHYHISAKGQGYPVGGHIHFGLVHKTGLPKKLPCTQDFIKLIDYFLGKIFVPLSGCARGEYARLTGYREQPHGFEYRSLPAAVFENPEIARISFKIALEIATKYYNTSDFSLKGTATLEEYKLYCSLTEDEVKYLYEFVNNYDNEDYAMNVVSNWVDRYDNPLTIEFFDLWNQDVKSKFKTEIKHIKVPRKLKVILYGVSSKKWGVKYAGFDNSYLRDNGYAMPHPPGCPHPKNGLAFGLPQGERAYTHRDGHGILGLEFCVDKIKNMIYNLNWDKVPIGVEVTSEILGVK